jgi:predicted ATP-grasp superfamily ATP-dependent carboligase
MAEVKKWPVIDSDVLSRVWSSVVRVSCANVCAGTALVVARTATHAYPTTNLYLWTDAVFAAHLSEAFKKELKRYASMCVRATASEE